MPLISNSPVRELYDSEAYAREQLKKANVKRADDYFHAAKSNLPETIAYMRSESEEFDEFMRGCVTIDVGSKVFARDGAIVLAQFACKDWRSVRYCDKLVEVDITPCIVLETSCGHSSIEVYELNTDPNAGLRWVKSKIMNPEMVLAIFSIADRKRTKDTLIKYQQKLLPLLTRKGC